MVASRNIDPHEAIVSMKQTLEGLDGLVFDACIRHEPNIHGLPFGSALIPAPPVA